MQAPHEPVTRGVLGLLVPEWRARVDPDSTIVGLRKTVYTFWGPSPFRRSPILFWAKRAVREAIRYASACTRPRDHWEASSYRGLHGLDGPKERKRKGPPQHFTPRWPEFSPRRFLLRRNYLLGVEPCSQSRLLANNTQEISREQGSSGLTFLEIP